MSAATSRPSARTSFSAAEAPPDPNRALGHRSCRARRRRRRLRRARRRPMRGPRDRRSVSSSSGLASASAKSTTVMLSSPPPRSRSRPERARPARGRERSLTVRVHGRLVDHGRETVRAEEEHVAGAGLDGEAVDDDGGIGAERPGDHGPLRMYLRLLRGQATGPNEVGDERMVLGQLLERCRL